ncbi:MAG: hypothetical protein M3383_07160 [Actinomycetota bacterium]|nr:hypothetical protein [Actinomycetota bacterium]
MSRASREASVSRRRHCELFIAGFLALALFIAGCGEDDAATSPDPSAALPQGSEPANLDPAEFTTEVDNPYMPLAVGSRWVYAETADGEPDQKVVVEVTDKTKTIANGVEAVVVRDTVTQGGEAVEITDDWFAQDAEGNVWYLGEDTAEYENGKLVCRCGSFEAGVDGAEAGIVMPADPQVGMAYRQEYYEGEAEDRAEVLSLDEKAQVPTGYYGRTLMTKDLVPTEPRVSEHKFYAEGVGLVLAVKTSGGGGREELVNFTPGR